MTTRKKIILSVIALLCAAALVAGAVCGIRAYRKNKSAFTVNDTLPDGEGKKATVILLGGQSNASGCSRDEYLQRNVSAEAYAAYEAGYDNVYINFFASGHHASNEFVKCGARQGEGYSAETGGFFGPELGLAEKLHEMHPDELFFIIKYAWGGTNLYEQWLSPSSKDKTGQLYKDFVGFVTSSMEYLTSKNYDVKIEGMCWMQGESDSFSTKKATNYELHLQNFIKDIRNTLSRYAADDGIAFIDACIAQNPVFWVYCDLVNASKQKVAETSPLNVLIDTNAHGLTCAEEPSDQPDLAHYDSLSELKLGHLFAEEVARFLG